MPAPTIWTVGKVFDTGDFKPDMRGLVPTGFRVRSGSTIMGFAIKYGAAYSVKIAVIWVLFGRVSVNLSEVFCPVSDRIRESTRKRSIDFSERWQ
jgi:hypothetical protein